MKREKLPLAITLVILIILSLPILYIVFGSFFLFGTGQAQSKFIIILSSFDTWKTIANTFELGFGASAISLTLAFFYSWIVARTDVYGKRFLRTIPVMGMTTPPVMNAIAWLFIFSPSNGLANIFIDRVFGLSNPIFNIFSMGGLIFAQGVGGVATTFFILFPAILSLPSALEESSAVSGHGTLRTISKISIPVLLPAILSAFILLAVLNIDLIDYVYFLSGPAQISILAKQVDFYTSLVPPDYESAAVLSVIYVILTLFLIGIYVFLTRQTKKYAVITGNVSQRGVSKLGKWKRHLGFLVCLGIMALNTFVPLGILSMLSLSSSYTAGLGSVYIRFSYLQNYFALFNLPGALQSLLTTIGFSILAAVFGTLLGVTLSYIALKSKTSGSRLADFASVIPLAFPGIVYSFGVFLMFLFNPGLSILYGSPWPLIMSLTFLFLPLSARVISGNIIQIGDEMEAASRVSGASWVRTFRRIVLPLSRSGIASSLLITFVHSLREFGGVLLLSTSQTLAFIVLLVDLYNAQGSSIGIFAAGAVVLIVFMLTLIIVMTILDSLRLHFPKRRMSK